MLPSFRYQRHIWLIQLLYITATYIVILIHLDSYQKKKYFFLKGKPLIFFYIS